MDGIALRPLYDTDCRVSVLPCELFKKLYFYVYYNKITQKEACRVRFYRFGRLHTNYCFSCSMSFQVASIRFANMGFSMARMMKLCLGVLMSSPEIWNIP